MKLKSSILLVILIAVITNSGMADDYSSSFELGIMSWESSNWHPESNDIDITINLPETHESINLHEDFFQELEDQRIRRLIRSQERRGEYQYRPYSDNSAERNFKSDFYRRWKDR